MRRLLALCGAAALVAAASDPARAADDVVCEYAELGLPGPVDNELQITTNDYVGEVEIDRRGDSILVKEDAGENIACGGSQSPTVTNIDLISLRVVRESVDAMIIDLRNGQFAPGAGLEPDGTAEIEVSLEGAPGTVLVVIGSSAADHIELGALDSERYAANLNAAAETAPDADVVGSNALVFTALRGGDDRVGSLGGGAFATGPFDFAFSAHGGKGNDVLIGNDRRNSLWGGPGDDRLVGNGLGDYLWGRSGRDRIEARDGRFDRLDCGSDRDEVRADPIDRRAGCE